MVGNEAKNEDSCITMSEMTPSDPPVQTLIMKVCAVLFYCILRSGTEKIIALSCNFPVTLYISPRLITILFDFLYVLIFQVTLSYICRRDLQSNCSISFVVFQKFLFCEREKIVGENRVM